MGWKSTKEITREEAQQALINMILTANNSRLNRLMDDVFGDDTELPYWGNNFNVVDNLIDFD